VRLVHSPPVDGFLIGVLVVAQALKHKVVPWKIHDISTTVRETTQNISILQIIDIVAFFQVEQSLFALSTLPFPGVSLQHTVLDRHTRIGFTESSIMECSSVVSSLVLGQELSATLFESSLLGSAGITGDTFELSASDIVLKLRSQ
jgi:hypothetical protein